eukprot:m.32674 g.32674  ORF g.32674 m.32674 type:complete len:281 (-) comp10811_c0_seq1:84-926(-)
MSAATVIKLLIAAVLIYKFWPFSGSDDAFAAAEYKRWTPQDTYAFLLSRGYTTEDASLMRMFMDNNGLRGSILPHLTDHELQKEFRIASSLVRKQMVLDFAQLEESAQPSSSSSSSSPSPSSSSHAFAYDGEPTADEGSSWGIFSLIWSLISFSIWMVFHAVLLGALVIFKVALSRHNNEMKPVSQMFAIDQFQWPDHPERRVVDNMIQYSPNYAVYLAVIVFCSFVGLVSIVKIGYVFLLCAAHAFFRKRSPLAAATSSFRDGTIFRDMRRSASRAFSR